MPGVTFPANFAALALMVVEQGKAGSAQDKGSAQNKVGGSQERGTSEKTGPGFGLRSRGPKYNRNGKPEGEEGEPDWLEWLHPREPRDYGSVSADPQGGSSGNGRGKNSGGQNGRFGNNGRENQTPGKNTAQVVPLLSAPGYRSALVPGGTHGPGTQYTILDHLSLSPAFSHGATALTVDGRPVREEGEYYIHSTDAERGCATVVDAKGGHYRLYSLPKRRDDNVIPLPGGPGGGAAMLIVEDTNNQRPDGGYEQRVVIARTDGNNSQRLLITGLNEYGEIETVEDDSPYLPVQPPKNGDVHDPHVPDRNYYAAATAHIQSLGLVEDEAHSDSPDVKKISFVSLRPTGEAGMIPQLWDSVLRQRQLTAELA
jgi:hypothetical protein